MTALRQPDFEPQHYSWKSQQSQSDRHQQLAIPPQAKRVVKNRHFPQQNQLPQNLKVLSALQKTSFSLALVSMLASTGLYIYTVQIPRLWSQEYRNLEDLQRQERELIAINEKIKYQIAREASQDLRLSISKPESAVFIPPAKVNLKTKLETPSSDRELVKIKHNNLGY